mgnify:CR=1 FL=1
MIRSKRCRLYSALVLAVIAVCALLCGIAFSGSAGADTGQEPVFDDEVSFREDYGIGYTLSVSAANFTAGEEKIAAAAVLTYEGETVAALSTEEVSFRYKLEQTGSYALTYYCEYGGEIYTHSFLFTVSDRPYFDHSLSGVYSIGSDLPLTATASYRGERVPATAKVNGRAVTDAYYHAASVGTVTVTFSAEFDGQTYEETTDVVIKIGDPSDLFIGVSGITSIEPNVDAAEIYRPGNGVRIMAGAPGSVARYSNVIDLNSLDQTTDLISFLPLSGDGYTALTEVLIRLVDVHDTSKSVYWRFYSVSWDSGGCTAYAGFNYDGRTMGRFNEGGDRFGEVRTDWMAQIPNATFDVNETTKTNLMWFSAQTDYANRSFYVTTELPAGQDPWLLLDADDSAQVGVGREWQGFTTGEVWLEIVVSGSGNTGVLVNEVAGQSLSGIEITDTTAPSVITDYADDANMPVGTVNQSYPIPQAARVLDAVEGELDPSSVEIELFKVNGILSEDCSDLIQDGAFVPQSAGTYRIRYTARDSSGNASMRYITAEISAEAAEITVSCALPETAFVGETINLPDVTVTGMTTLTTRTVQYSFNGTPLSVGAGSDYMFTEEGTLSLYYEFIDYVNNRRSATLEMQVKISPDPVITVRGMPYTAISGNDLYLPDFTAYDYNYPQTDARFEPVKSITVNGKSVSASERRYTVTERAGETLEVILRAGSASEPYTIDVIDPVYLSDYFLYSSSSAVTGINAENYTGFRFNGDLTLRTVNAVVVDNYSGFVNSFGIESETGTVEVWMTDYLRPYKSIFFRINLATDMLSINGMGTEYALNTSAVTLRYREIGSLLSDYGVITSWEDGTAVDGFERGLAVIEWRVSGIGGENTLALYQLGMTNLVTRYVNGVPQPFEDNGVPSIVLSASVYDQSPSVGQALFIPAAEGYQALSGSCNITVTVYNAAGEAVIEDALANTDYYYIVDNYGVWLIEYCVTYAGGAIDMRSMPITISSSVPPVAQIAGEIPETAAFGTSFTLPQAEASGVGETEVYWSLTAPDGMVKVYENGDTIEWTQAGTYRLTLMASDDWNYTVYHYVIEVQEG